MSADLYSCTADLTSQLDSPCKTTSIWPSICYIPCCVSQFMAISPSCQLICTVAWLIWHHQWICLEKLHQFDLSFFKFPGVYLNLCQLYLHFSWFVQLHSWFELTTGLALINYPYLTFNMLNSLVCISIYGIFIFMWADLYSTYSDFCATSYGIIRTAKTHSALKGTFLL